ncbi:MAG: hypothetical protein U0694_18520 [Anaerolineae bacterium]
MSILTNWYNDEKTILYHTYEATWTWNDLYVAVDKAYALLESVDHTVDIIIDMRLSRIIPSNVFNHGKYTLVKTHPRRGYMIIVGAPRLAHILFQAFLKIYDKEARGLRVVFVTTVEEGLDQIHELHAQTQSA